MEGGLNVMVNRTRKAEVLNYQLFRRHDMRQRMAEATARSVIVMRISGGFGVVMFVFAGVTGKRNKWSRTDQQEHERQEQQGPHPTGQVCNSSHHCSSLLRTSNLSCSANRGPDARNQNGLPGHSRLPEDGELGTSGGDMRTVKYLRF